MNIYLDVSIHEKGCEIYDWTEHIQVFSNIAPAWQVNDLVKRMDFKMIAGKHVNYHISGIKDYDQAKQFAIWYHVNKASGNIRSYRLD